MRVIGGDRKGKTLYAPKSHRIRITTDRVKKSLFDILPPMGGLSFLDFYAGTGNVGIEALSRGAGKVVFIEKESLHFHTIKKNLHVCGFTSGYVTFLGHVDKGVRILEKTEELFDVIFVDPPYEKGLVKEALSLIASAGLLKSGGTVAVEHSIREDVGGNGVLTMTDQRRYGDTVLSFFENDDTREVTHGENSSISRII